MSDADIDLKAARALVRDLARRRPAVYWADFLLTVAVAWSALVLAVIRFDTLALAAPLIVVAALAMYRATVFTHELAHMRRGEMPAFRLAWNLLCGLPILLPSFTYDEVHLQHHRGHTYATAEDGEYLPFARRAPRLLALYLLGSFVTPPLLVFRWGILTPAAAVSPGFARWVWARASSMIIDPDFVRAPHAIRSDVGWRRQEAAACLLVWAVAGALAAGVLPLAAIAVGYATAVLAKLINCLRTMAAHAYRLEGGTPAKGAAQFLDSIDIPGNPLTTPLWAPVGLRYHAMHHLFPGLPYHSLGVARRRLMARPEFRPALQAVTRDNLPQALASLWRESWAAGRHRAASAHPIALGRLAEPLPPTGLP